MTPLLKTVLFPTSKLHKNLTMFRINTKKQKIQGCKHPDMPKPKLCSFPKDIQAKDLKWKVLRVTVHQNLDTHWVTCTPADATNFSQPHLFSPSPLSWRRDPSSHHHHQQRRHPWWGVCLTPFPPRPAALYAPAAALSPPLRPGPASSAAVHWPASCAPAVSVPALSGICWIRWE